MDCPTSLSRAVFIRTLLHVPCEWLYLYLVVIN